MGRLLRQLPWRDGNWVEPELPTRVSFGRKRFPESLRDLRVNRDAQQFRYVNWMLFLFSLYVIRLLMLWYMVTGTFGVTTGVPLDLLPHRFTSVELQQLQSGNSVYDESGTRIADGRVDQIAIVELTSENQARFEDGAEDLDERLGQLCEETGRPARVILAVHLAENVSYQQVVSLLDDLARRAPDGCVPIAVFVGPDA